MRAAAEEHRANTDVFARAAALPCRDSRGEGDDEQPYARQSPSTHVEAIAAAGVPVYQLSGWHDMWVRDAFLWHANLTGPRKLLVGDWSHNGRDGVDTAAEHLRWFDHWLKGVDTGVMDEPPIRYQRRNAPPARSGATRTNGRRPESARRGCTSVPARPCPCPPSTTAP